ncbi:ribosylnicotinamide kinase [Ceratobasidium sp. 423]|nr:ribosylnicotinamide kinase [Ceratobasidium sp. 423]
MTIRVITVGIGGASSAGKTTLARQLSSVLPECTVVHQDDYWSDPDECVIHPVYNEPYLEDPPTAIKWPLFRERVRQLKSASKYSDISKWAEESYSNNSDGNKTPEDESLQDFGKLPDSVVAEWSRRFHELDEEWKSRGTQLKWCIVEGWHLYYDPVRIE